MSTTIDTDTDTTPTFTDGDSGTGRRWGRLGVAVGAAIAVAAMGIVVSNAGDDPAQRPALTQHEQRLAAELAAVAEWAEAHGLSGLSPASLTAIDRTRGFEARRAEMLAAIAEAAVAGGLSGLSPASLRPVGE